MTEQYWRETVRRRAREVNSLPVLLLDGAMGTWLEDKYGEVFDEEKPAWASDATPKNIYDVHMEYLNSGADIISTATYQALPQNMALNRPDAECLSSPEVRMRSLVEVATRAISDHGSKRSLLGTPRPAVALSLSAYGGTMKPSTEYTGQYLEMVGREPLSKWHEERLMIYARRKPEGSGCYEHIWKDVQYVAFETLVSASEAESVAMAMGCLQRTLEREGREHEVKPFWICVNFPDRDDGKLLSPCGDTPAEIVHAMLKPPENYENWSRPFGIGVNCTKIQKMGQLVMEFEEALLKLVRDDETLPKPWLVIYPDGALNKRYNSHTKSWETVSEAGQENNEQAFQWAPTMMSLVEEIAQRANWPGLVIGGCCKSKPSDIKALASLIEKSPRKHHDRK